MGTPLGQELAFPPWKLVNRIEPLALSWGLKYSKIEPLHKTLSS